MSHRLRILALEPYYGGSHRAVLDGLVSAIDADWTLVTLPARKWKWRMRGAAITMADQLRSPSGERALAPFDVIFASTFVNLAEFRGLAGGALARTPAVVYFHENQLAYPNQHVAEWDFQFPLTNITSALSAERCLFNSRWNLEGFLDRIPGFLRGFPDHQPRNVVERIAEKSSVLAPPFDPAVFAGAGVSRGPLPRIVWPHRWEHDKDPEAFFQAVKILAEEGLDFQVAVAGQAFKDVPAPILSAEETLGSRLVHLGQPESREAYAGLLSTCDISVSTARNEFFGIAMVESAYAGCWPLVPHRLAYPEVYPPEMRYSDHAALVARLRSLVLERPREGLARHIGERYALGVLAAEYERVFREVAGRGATG